MAWWHPSVILSFPTAQKGVFKLVVGLAAGLHPIGAVNKPAYPKWRLGGEFMDVVYRLLHLYFFLPAVLLRHPRYKIHFGDVKIKKKRADKTQI
jgi:hypothetical protein